MDRVRVRLDALLAETTPAPALSPSTTQEGGLNKTQLQQQQLQQQQHGSAGGDGGRGGAFERSLTHCLRALEAGGRGDVAEEAVAEVVRPLAR